MADTILSMGPEGDQWHYDRTTGLYDLSRGSPDTLTVATTAGVAGRKVALAPARTALVIVDMQNYFLHPTCLDHPTGLATVTPMRQLIQDCRTAGIRIIWLNWGLTDADLATLPAALVNGFARKTVETPANETAVPTGLGVDLGGGMGRALVAGAWNSAVYGGGGPAEAGHGGLAAEVRPDLGDLACPKNRISGLWSPEAALWRMLVDELPQMRTLLFAGVNTDQCVQGTLVDAYNGGWDCVAVEDCCATTSPGAHAVTMWNVWNNYGFVTDSQAVSAAVQEAS